MLPWHYLHNSVRKRVTSQEVILVTGITSFVTRSVRHARARMFQKFSLADATVVCPTLLAGATGVKASLVSQAKMKDWVSRLELEGIPFAPASHTYRPYRTPPYIGRLVVLPPLRSQMRTGVRLATVPRSAKGSSLSSGVRLRKQNGNDTLCIQQGAQPIPR